MKKPHILIVEDEILIAKIIKSKLLMLGYRVSDVVTSGKEAIEKIHENQPDLILMDIVLPGKLDGIQTAEKIQSIFNIPIVYLSGYSDDETFGRIMKTNPFGYILKPFETRELHINIEMALYKHDIESELKKSEERYRDLVEKAEIAIVIDDKEGNFIYFNQKFADLFGFTMAQMKKQSIQTLVHPDDVERVMDIHRKRILGQRPESRYEFRAIRKDGSTIYLELDAVRILEGDEVTGTRSYIWDITPRRRAEEAFRESENKYRILVENANELIAVAQDDTLKFLNAKVFDITGYDSKELINKNFSKFLHPDDRQRVMDYAKNRSQGKEVPQYYTCRIIDKEGRIRWLRSSAVVINWDNKPASLAFVSDVTELKQTEEALIESKKKYKSLYSMMRLMCDNVPDLIWAKDLKKKYVFTNKAICEKLLNAKDTDEPIGKTHMYFANRERKNHPENPQYHTFAEICEKSDNVVMKSKKPQRFDEFGNVKGKHLFLNVHKVPFLNEQGNMIGTVGCGRDVTKEKMLEEERKRVNEELVNSREVLRNLSTHLQTVREEERTHISREIHDELGQALTALKMDLYWLNSKLPTDQKSLIKKTKSMLQLLDKTIQSVKRISTDLRPGLLDDLGLVAAIEWQTGEFQNRTGIKCKFSFNSDDIVIDQDMATALFRIFQESLTNVARHAKASSVQVNLKCDNNNIMLQVKDNGIGITEAQISDARSFGLIGMRERVHPFGGKVVIQAKKDKGTTLSVTIPMNSIPS